MATATAQYTTEELNELRKIGTTSPLAFNRKMFSDMANKSKRLNKKELAEWVLDNNVRFEFPEMDTKKGNRNTQIDVFVDCGGITFKYEIYQINIYTSNGAHGRWYARIKATRNCDDKLMLSSNVSAIFRPDAQSSEIIFNWLRDDYVRYFGQQFRTKKMSWAFDKKA